MNDIKLQRTRDQWEKCDPEAMSRMSQGALFHALNDAKRDVLAMHDAIKGAAIIANVAGAEIRNLKQAANSPETVNQEYKSEPVRTYPEELTPALREVLGMMLWHTTPIAHALRASGQAIARKVEDEQAVVLHWLTGIVLQHGDEWQKNAAIELRKLTDTLG